jgi:hypothetical protein
MGLPLDVFCILVVILTVEVAVIAVVIMAGL